uniref:ATP synthase F0 subunit 6 n=1 Tax=Batracomorphus nigromarginattus TaxID=1962548 RepID=UPI00257B2B54|nr:ATP synthase F0 subunit 6 [Batracomorphus nigromarginattus]WHE42668.1 ATP synthase F0 subunit 6 [Batracomorphus nigromarginattus]
MMMNLFSTFDPCTGKLSLNWISTIMFILIIPKKFWKKNNMNQNLMNKIFKKLNDEIKMNTMYKSIKLIMMSMIMLILTNNMMGILPYVFTSTSQINFAMSLSLPMWTSYMMFGWKKNTKLMLTNMLPKNTPLLIMPLMIMIEFSSNLIRPASLAIRLSANMIAGHLMMSLLGEKSIMLIMMMMILMMFEMAVAVIQSYVFTTLMTLYSSEV